MNRISITNKLECGKGFTLVELLIAMLVSSILLLAVYVTYDTQLKGYGHQRELARMQQGLRAAMFMIKNDIRNSGREKSMMGAQGIINIRRVNIDADDPLGYPSLQMTTNLDTDNDGWGDSQAIFDYQLMDSNGDGRRELWRIVTIGPNPPVQQLVMDGVEDMGFAYAFDADNDRDMDRNGNSVIWAIDTNNDNFLDTSIDSNNDGDIDLVDMAAPMGLGMNVRVSDIRAVRIWLLARSRRDFQNFQDTSQYVLGHKLFTPTVNNDNFRRLLLTGSVALKNFKKQN